MSTRKACKAPPAPADSLDAAATVALMESRRKLEALEASRGWAGRIVLAGAVGDQPGLVRGAMAFLLHFLGTDAIDAHAASVRRALERRAPDLLPAVDRVVADRAAAVEGAALLLGIAIGQQTRVDVDEMKAARARVAFDAAGIKGELAAAARNLKAAPFAWRCDEVR